MQTVRGMFNWDGALCTVKGTASYVLAMDSLSVLVEIANLLGHSAHTCVQILSWYQCIGLLGKSCL